MAVGRVLQGNIGEGIRLLEEGIHNREKEGYRVAAIWYRLFLVEVYIQIMSGNEGAGPPSSAPKYAGYSKGNDHRRLTHFRPRNPRSENSHKSTVILLDEGICFSASFKGQEKASARGSTSDRSKADTISIWTIPLARSQKPHSRIVTIALLEGG